jgi:hypothetical protein
MPAFCGHFFAAVFSWLFLMAVFGTVPSGPFVLGAALDYASSVHARRLRSTFRKIDLAPVLRIS